MATSNLPPPPAPSASCPACHSPVAPDSRFCNHCGANLSAPAAPSATAAPPANVDIRGRVDQDRGFLKKLQLLIPGFRGYREGEDARVADSLLRQQIADRLRTATATVQACRSTLTQAGQFDALMPLAPLVSDLQVMEGHIRNAEQGYSGISAALKMGPAQLDRLYEYDYGFAQAADQLGSEAEALRTVAAGPGASGAAAQIQAIRDQLVRLDGSFKARTRVVQGIQV